MVHRLSAVRKQEDLLFVCQSPGAMATRSWQHSSVTAQVLLQSKAAGQLSTRGRGFFGSGFYEVHSEVCVCVCVCVHQSWGHDPRLCWPLCLLAAALLPHWATSLRLTDLTICRQSFSRCHGNYFLPAPTNTYWAGLWLATPAKEETEQMIMVWGESSTLGVATELKMSLISILELLSIFYLIVIIS